MSDTYTKLFSSITASTIWLEPSGTRLTWITMLAMSDRHGCIFASVPGLADRAKVSREEVEVALACFLAPDPDSRTREHEGRRIEVIDGGWRLLNHDKFREIRSAEERRQYMRDYMRDKRAKALTGPLTKLAELAEVAPPTPAPDKKKQEHVPQAARFEEFWSAYPVKRGKKTAREKWISKRLDSKADDLIEDVKKRVQQDQQWLSGFAPHPSTYLHQERWQDELKGRSKNGDGERRGYLAPYHRSAADKARAKNPGLGREIKNVLDKMK